MEISVSEWYAAIFNRRSRRQFELRPLDPGLLAKMKKVCNEFHPFPEARAVLVTQGPDRVFKGVLGSYGKIKGAPAFIAFVGDMGHPFVQEKIGYFGEGILLEATALNLGTCWVGGMFRPEVVRSLIELHKNEKVLAVTPLGYARGNLSLQEKIMVGIARSHHRKPFSELSTGLDETRWPAWIKTALEAARLAPSAVNRQPWRFNVQERSITVSVDDPKDTYHISKRLDCGIAMLHIEVSALHSGVPGKWDFLEAPGVARFGVL